MNLFIIFILCLQNMLFSYNIYEIFQLDETNYILPNTIIKKLEIEKHLIISSNNTYFYSNINLFYFTNNEIGRDIYYMQVDNNGTVYNYGFKYFGDNERLSKLVGIPLEELFYDQFVNLEIIRKDNKYFKKLIRIDYKKEIFFTNFIIQEFPKIEVLENFEEMIFQSDKIKNILVDLRNNNFQKIKGLKIKSCVIKEKEFIPFEYEINDVREEKIIMNNTNYDTYKITIKLPFLISLFLKLNNVNDEVVIWIDKQENIIRKLKKLNCVIRYIESK